MQGRQGQTVPESPRPFHGPWHGLLVSKLIGHMHKASWNVEQTRYPVKTRHVFIPVYVRYHVECAALTGNGLTKYIQTDANE